MTCAADTISSGVRLCGMSSSHHHVQARGVEKIDSYDRDVNAVAREDEEYITYPEICQATERRLVRKLDSRLLPTIMIIFIINYMDLDIKFDHAAVIRVPCIYFLDSILEKLIAAGIAAWTWLLYIEGSVTIINILSHAHLAEDAGEADQYPAKVSVFDQDGHERYQDSSLCCVLFAVARSEFRQKFPNSSTDLYFYSHLRVGAWDVGNYLETASIFSIELILVLYRLDRGALFPSNGLKVRGGMDTDCEGTKARLLWREATALSIEGRHARGLLTTSQDFCHRARTLATPDLSCQSAPLQWSWSATSVPYHPWQLPGGFTLASIWEANAIPRPPAKRSVAMGLINEFGVT
ncbi:hypothetical protein EV424DRAFT_1344794 [Suillus variegatus]|nr:hypothetical protein EV424DRAFT_1344794 [Suillus variegatus]